MHYPGFFHIPAVIRDVVRRFFDTPARSQEYGRGNGARREKSEKAGFSLP